MHAGLCGPRRGPLGAVSEAGAKQK